MQVRTYDQFDKTMAHLLTKELSNHPDVSLIGVRDDPTIKGKVCILQIKSRTGKEGQRIVEALLKFRQQALQIKAELNPEN